MQKQVEIQMHAQEDKIQNKQNTKTNKPGIPTGFYIWILHRGHQYQVKVDLGPNFIKKKRVIYTNSSSWNSLKCPIYS